MKPPTLAVTAVPWLVGGLAVWMWLAFVHDPRVAEDALAEVRIDSIMEAQGVLLAEVDSREAQIDSLQLLSASLRDSLAQAVVREAETRIAREATTRATDSVLESVSRGTLDSTSLVRIRFAFQREREAWAEELAAVRDSRDELVKLFTNSREQVSLLAQNQDGLRSALTDMTMQWESAEDRFRRARNPGLFRRLEISTPFALAGVLAGFLLGAAATR